jgi:hypothetical protein
VPDDVMEVMDKYMGGSVVQWTVDLPALPYRCVVCLTLADLFMYMPSVVDAMYGDPGGVMVGKFEKMTNDFSQSDRILQFVSRSNVSQNPVPDHLIRLYYLINEIRVSVDKIYVEERSRELLDLFLLEMAKEKVETSSRIKMMEGSGKLDYLEIERALEAYRERYCIAVGYTETEIAANCRVTPRVVRSVLQGRTDLVYWYGRWSLSIFFKGKISWRVGDKQDCVYLQRVRDDLVCERKTMLRGNPSPEQLWYLKFFFVHPGNVFYET